MSKDILCFVFGSLFMLAAFQDNVLAMFASILMVMAWFVEDRDRQ